jgi:hypothetical protein
VVRSVVYVMHYKCVAILVFYSTTVVQRQLIQQILSNLTLL